VVAPRRRWGARPDAAAAAPPPPPPPAARAASRAHPSTPVSLSWEVPRSEMRRGRVRPPASVLGVQAVAAVAVVGAAGAGPSRVGRGGHSAASPAARAGAAAAAAALATPAANSAAAAAAAAARCCRDQPASRFAALTAAQWTAAWYAPAPFSLTRAPVTGSAQSKASAISASGPMQKMRRMSPMKASYPPGPPWTTTWWT